MSFLDLVKAVCNVHGVELRLREDSYVQTRVGIRCNGFFEEYPPTLAVAIGKPEEKWMKTLIHEYAHMLQWINKTPVWNKASYPVDAEEIVELWYDKKIDLSEKQRKYWIDLGRNIEKEAEQKVLNLIKEYRLDIDPVTYTQHANAYLYFWTFTGLVRRWYEIGKEPYNISEIVDAMPKTLDVDHSQLPKEYEQLYRKYC